MPNSNQTRPRHLQPVPDNATLQLSKREQTDKWTIYKRRAVAGVVGAIALIGSIKAVEAITPDGAPPIATKEQVVDALMSEPKTEMKTIIVPQGAGSGEVAKMLAHDSEGEPVSVERNPVYVAAIDQIIREKQGIPENGFIQDGVLNDMPTAELSQETAKLVEPQVNP